MRYYRRWWWNHFTSGS